MLTDPQSVTISGATSSLPRVSSGDNKSTYRSADGTVELFVSHAIGRRHKRIVKISHQKVAPDPLYPAQNVPYSMSTHLVVDVPPVGYSVAEAKAVVDGLIAALTASSGALVTKLLGGEN